MCQWLHRVIGDCWFNCVGRRWTNTIDFIFKMVSKLLSWVFTDLTVWRVQKTTKTQSKHFIIASTRMDLAGPEIGEFQWEEDERHRWSWYCSAVRNAESPAIGSAAIQSCIHYRLLKLKSKTRRIDLQWSHLTNRTASSSYRVWSEPRHTDLRGSHLTNETASSSYVGGCRWWVRWVGRPWKPEYNCLNRVSI